MLLRTIYQQYEKYVIGEEKVQPEEQVKRLENYLDYVGIIIDWMQRLWFLLPILAVIVVFTITFILFKYNCKKITRSQIYQYEKNDKYISGLFVELNNSKEWIRAFCYPKKWKHRLISRYNTLFNDKMGKQVCNVYSERNIKIKISHFMSIKNLAREICATRGWFQKIQKREVECNSDYKNTNMLYECFGHSYSQNLEEMEESVKYLASDYMIVTGTAGNGKTVMLCSSAEMLMANNSTVLFLNARDINESLFTYIRRKMTSERLKYFFPLWWSLQVFKHKILRKNIYILIDAINENDSKEFLETFEDGIYSLIKHNNVKVVVSCRSEYFDVRYKKFLLTEKLEPRASFLNLQADKYSDIAIERMFRNYETHYNFTGEISELVKEKLSNQLLLVKIFFEVYEGKNDSVYELNKYKLYKTYIDNLEDIELKEIVKKLAQFMFEEGRYENIELSKLEVARDKYKIIDSSILVCRDLIKNAGNIREETEEVVNFVYDEMRDYLITQQILIICEDEVEEIDTEKVKSIILDFVNKNANCLEGVVNYLFNYFFATSNEELIEYLLEEIIKRHDKQIDDSRNWRSAKLNSWGLNLIFESGAIKFSAGKKYIDFILTENPAKEAQKLLTFLVKQEMKKGQYGIHIILEALLQSKNREEVATKIGNTLADWRGQGITVGALIEIDKKLVEANSQGTDDFRIYVFLILKCYDWKNKSETIKYFQSKFNRNNVEKYLEKLRVCISDENNNI